MAEAETAPNSSVTVKKAMSCSEMSHQEKALAVPKIKRSLAGISKAKSLKKNQTTSEGVSKFLANIKLNLALIKSKQKESKGADEGNANVA